MRLVTGNKERIYVNTAIGCEGHCTYCYLPQLGVNQTQYFSVNDVMKEFENCTFFEEGKQGTIISIGCYSECLDTINKKKTIELLRHFSQYSNYIQLATKQEISYEEFKEVDEILKYEGQLHMYISLPTYSSAKEMEPNCALPERRLSILRESSKFRNIKIYLYIKPIINNVTIHDVEKYKELMNEYNVDCVVGNMLYQNVSEGQKIQVGDEFFYELHTSDGHKIRNELAVAGKVYNNSIDTIKDFCFRNSID